MAIKVLIEISKLLLFNYSINIVYTAVRWIFVLIQRIIWIVNGTQGAIRNSKKDPDVCVHIQNIIFRYKLDPLAPPGKNNFITTHGGFKDIDYVLKPSVTLHYVTHEEAVFVETDPNIDVNHSSSGSFLMCAQFLHAKNLIVIPIQHFNAIAENLGQPKGKMVFVGNTMRCGSTLLCQIFENTGHCVGICEPVSLTVMFPYMDKIPQDELDRLVRNVVILQCKPTDKDIKCYMIKLQGWSMTLMPCLARVFPDAVNLFMYREGKTAVPSIMRMSTQLPMFRMMTLCGTLHPYVQWFVFKATSLGGCYKSFSCDTEYSFCTYLWALLISMYTDCRKQGIDIKAIKYEHLMADPAKFTRNILEYLRLPVEWAADGVKALENDSQHNSALRSSRLQNAKHETLNDEILLECDTICKQFNLPPFLSPLDFEDLITSF